MKNHCWLSVLAFPGPFSWFEVTYFACRRNSNSRKSCRRTGHRNTPPSHSNCRRDRPPGGRRARRLLVRHEIGQRVAAVGQADVLRPLGRLHKRGVVVEVLHQRGVDVVGLNAVGDVGSENPWPAGPAAPRLLAAAGPSSPGPPRTLRHASRR